MKEKMQALVKTEVCTWPGTAQTFTENSQDLEMVLSGLPLSWVGVGFFLCDILAWSEATSP